MIPDLEMVLRLAAAGLLGGVIGYERQARHKSAGLRTHILVSMGSCLIMILSINIYSTVQGLTNADPARLAAQVVSGIGFLGAGSIMKEGLTVKGLTTAASLWVVSGVGLAVGGGYYLASVVTTLLVFITLAVLTKVEYRNCTLGTATLAITTTTDKPGQLGVICSTVGRLGVSIVDIQLEEAEPSVIVMSINLPEHRTVTEVIGAISAIAGVTAVRHEC
ncbi:MgtC/SapB family protein|uniref:Putative Mg2+ transporter-C (MgtC) family protein n=1 Tax=Dendrosporobacter quercicolus TaxID=146817 RepID=A0A1G9YVR3_9FIRM|nr:MgtC/SapB family protein [Dendrosporobacter quercicolus]NSL49288.1 MgtC/SapB family protein [Dendrosporobacter quercicolus DSM 1736]SDN13248.1 putative Mg2+ transporter-C (MgtC) family protein [Dendrosporobacter quercicolus]